MLITNFRLRYTLYKVILVWYQWLDAARIHPVRERSLRALDRTVDYIDACLPDALGFDTQKEVIAYALKMVQAEGHYMEFGVFVGGTIRYMARLRPRASFHGFDSFEGLPEMWGGFNMGRHTLDRKGRLPRVPSNVTLHKGWFCDTLPRWRAGFPGPVAFIHIDSDIYSSAVEALEAMADRVQPGTVILFDEYFNYPNWEKHEYRAWQEFVRKYGIKYEYLAYARQQVAVRITAVKA